MTDRLYRATDADGKARLIRATSPAQAYRHLARNTWTVDIPSTVQTAELVASGVRVESAHETEQEHDHA